MFEIPYEAAVKRALCSPGLTSLIVLDQGHIFGSS